MGRHGEVRQTPLALASIADADFDFRTLGQLFMASYPCNTFLGLQLICSLDGLRGYRRNTTDTQAYQ